MHGTAVIIPFFQREPRSLGVAIRSALAQEGAGLITVVVCDDESPVPAETELSVLTPKERAQVILVVQKNRGPGPARNAALDAVPPGTKWIAFLDSDDVWAPTHLSRSMAALEEGYDLCFADALREPETTTHFQNAAFEPGQHEPIGALPGLFALKGDFVTLNIAMSPVSISTVVIRASTLGDMRFPSMAFEDLVYWFEAARRGARVAFDETLQVRYGRGNITITENWVSQRELQNILSYHRVFMSFAKDTSLTAPQRAILEQRIASNRELFSVVTLGLMYSAKLPARRIVVDFLALDRLVIGAFLKAVLTVLRRRLKRSLCRRSLPA